MPDGSDNMEIEADRFKGPAVGSVTERPKSQAIPQKEYDAKLNRRDLLKKGGFLALGATLLGAFGIGAYKAGEKAADQSDPSQALDQAAQKQNEHYKKLDEDLINPVKKPTPRAAQAPNLGQPIPEKPIIPPNQIKST